MYYTFIFVDNTQVPTWDILQKKLKYFLSENEVKPLSSSNIHQKTNMSTAFQLPHDVLKIIFSYTSNFHITGNNKLIELKKIPQKKYHSLRKLYSSSKLYSPFTRRPNLNIIYLITNDNRQFYSFHQYGENDAYVYYYLTETNGWVTYEYA